VVKKAWIVLDDKEHKRYAALKAVCGATHESIYKAGLDLIERKKQRVLADKASGNNNEDHHKTPHRP